MFSAFSQVNMYSRSDANRKQTSFELQLFPTLKHVSVKFFFIDYNT